jgi:hypothetical protein
MFPAHESTRRRRKHEPSPIVAASNRKRSIRPTSTDFLGNRIRRPTASHPPANERPTQRNRFASSNHRKQKLPRLMSILFCPCLKRIAPGRNRRSASPSKVTIPPNTNAMSPISTLRSGGGRGQRQHLPAHARLPYEDLEPLWSCTLRS